MNERRVSPATRWARPMALAAAVILIVVAVTRLIAGGSGGGGTELHLSRVVVRSLPEASPYPNRLLSEGRFDVVNPIPGISPEPGEASSQQSSPQAQELREQLKALGLVEGYARIWAGEGSSSMVSILVMRLERTATLSSTTRFPLGNSFQVPDAPTTEIDTGIANSQAFVVNLEQEGGGGWIGWVTFVRGPHLLTVQAFLPSREEVERVIGELGRLQDEQARRLGLT